jgi:iron only hydrogenase large subunit-like protein
MVSAATRKLLQDPSCKKPLISSACPAVVRLIQVRFPNLIDNLVKIESPMELSAAIARSRAAKSKGLNPEDIGVFFITPCAAKATSIKSPYGKALSEVSCTVSIKDIYVRMLTALEKTVENQENLVQSGFEGIRWANSGGESLAAGTEKFLAVDGIHNVITILDEIENERLQEVDFIEALACQGGCLGGPLTVENLYVAKTRIKKHIDEARGKEYAPADEYCEQQLELTGMIESRPVMKLDEDIIIAMKKLEELESIHNSLPGLDCGACGAPNCRALAEDIVRGLANETDCIFKLREKVRDLAEQMAELESKMPPVMDKSKAIDN